MRYTLRTKRVLVGTAAGAMVLGMLPGAAFADRAAVCANADEGVFNDVPSSNVHSDNIDCVAAYGITGGVGGGNYAPNRDVNRDQMATFLVNLGNAALDGEFDVAATSPFTDIAGNTHESNIKTAFAEEITTGTQTPGIYAPRAFVTRAQMATFVVNTISAAGYDIPAADRAFTDTAGNVHEDNINRLASTGVVLGRTANTYAPNAFISRDQMATFLANAAGLLDDEGFWNAPRLPGDELSFTLLDDDAPSGGDLNTTDSRGDDTLLETQNLIALSDGNAVTLFQFSVADDEFFIEGDAATPTAFLAAFETGATLEATPRSDGSFSHNIIAAELVLAGTVGNGDATDFAIVDAPSGVALTDITDEIALGQTYTVDGSVATQGQFLASLSVGDSISVEVLSAGTEADFSDFTFRHNLTNGTLSGELVDQLDDAGTGFFEVDVNSDDDGQDAGVPNYVVTDVDDVSVTLTIDGGTATTLGDISAVIGTTGFDNGGAVSYARAARAVTISYTSVDADESATVKTGTVVGVSGNPAVIETAEGTINTAAASSIRVDGVITAQSELETTLSAGDVATLTVAFGATTGPLVITSGSLSGELEANAGVNTYNVVISDDETTTVDIAGQPFGYSDDVANTFFLGGTQVSQGAWVTAVDLAIADADNTVNFEAVDTGLGTQYRATVS